ncbi:bifunctional 4-hydroxy-2-oxoglutarate aldolase/2-dehydro-3-deoxy-phosphogluconate aldolase [Urechidicola vernalis]|uniref:Bifunctional 4-hydroxy-2-oxoglutarate aldolase/2-dehydro-3-deoxy-phosphogluconate aldolase n=1 Tax=Urechidicola vernalis TaxID=3075600 RepID=A0ABU2Y1H5_9FLAO|nr:bifunctional 4-hydroxy-2-oxoglutarate aldolase/2-dehydro-3-deoxy-phosphogluconate aldolase [Urechidicola sp. P050]MDT0551862.1 bifunctional 4-hydroxy-2-oxoglutarate aldolase/2-dehydro-3-deoxy-phosphogluconate aldolase [Urechidicola sp. P050]
MTAVFNQNLFDQMPVIGILRNASLESIEKILPYYKKAGFTNLEITMNSKNVETIIQKLSSENSDMNIGAGTVCSLDDLKRALNAGATFIVTPILNTEVINYCRTHQIPVFPGAFSPTEIYNATNLGATAVKVFPATQLGVSYIKDILAPLNNAKLLPTGGVSKQNIAAFLNAGAIGVGMGGSLFDKKLIESENFDQLFQHFKEIATIVLKNIK